MANSQGGGIVLGVREDGDMFTAIGVKDPEKVVQDFWNQVNNRQVVSANILNDDYVTVRKHAAISLIYIRVPMATRRNRPIYVGTNPLTGTYRRNNEGDYRCPEAVWSARCWASRSMTPWMAPCQMDFRWTTSN